MNMLAASGVRDVVYDGDILVCICQFPPCSEIMVVKVQQKEASEDVVMSQPTTVLILQIQPMM